MCSSKLAGQRRSGSPEDLDLPLDKNLPFIKRCTPFLLLLVILMWGYSLRAYHLDYPVVGYHNVKEAHTLGEALNFYRGEPLLVPRMRYYAPDDMSRGVNGDNFPLVAWMIALGWKLFGVKLWVARFVMVLFSLGIIALTYIVVKQLFKKEDISLFAALLAAACPVTVFFGRNVQYDVPAAFFLIGTIAAYLQWRKDPKPAWFGLMALSFALAAVSKWPSVIILFPIALTFPYDRVFPLTALKAHIKQYVLAIPPAALTLWWWFYSKSLNPQTAVSVTSDSVAYLSQFFTRGWWAIVYQYAYTDNFSKIGVWFAIFGVILSLVFIKKFSYRFLALWAVSFLPYGLLFANFLSHHNYYQIPYAPLWAILLAVFLSFVVSLIPKVKLGLLPLKSLRWIVLLAFFFFVLKAPLTESADRQFATQFYGLDVAGEYVKAHSALGELIMDSGHQDRGLLWHADRELINSNNLSMIIEAENKRDLNWVFVYQWGIYERVLGIPEIAEHIYSNYTLRQFAYCFGCLGGGPQQVNEVYYLYQRGGSSPTREEFLTNISQYAQEHPLQKRAYDDPFGQQIELNYITFD